MKVSRLKSIINKLPDDMDILVQYADYDGTFLVYDDSDFNVFMNDAMDIVFLCPINYPKDDRVYPIEEVI